MEMTTELPIHSVNSGCLSESWHTGDQIFNFLVGHQMKNYRRPPLNEYRASARISVSIAFQS